MRYARTLACFLITMVAMGDSDMEFFLETVYLCSMICNKNKNFISLPTRDF